MAVHNIFFGGKRTESVGLRSHMLPSTPPGKDDCMEADQRHSPVLFSLTRRLVWKCEDEVRHECPPPCSSEALGDYICRNPIAVDDVLVTHIMPRLSMLQYVWWKVDNPITPFSMDLRVRGCSRSLGGTEATPAPVVLGTIDGTLGGDATDITSGVIDVTALNGGPLYFDQNDFLELVINELPDPASDPCCECTTGGIKESNLMISPVVLEFCRGEN